MSTVEKKMLRSVLDRQHEMVVEAQEGMSTPLRGGTNVGYPRIRLMDKHSKLAPIPVYTLQSNKPTTGLLSNTRDKIRETKPELWMSRLQPRQDFLDRFIPQRRRQNFAASNYLLTKVPPRVEGPNELDVFDQIVNIDSMWRKKQMKRALEKCYLFPGSRKQRVLNIGNSYNTDHRPNEEKIEENDGVWKTKARKKVLIGLTDIVTKIPTMRHNYRQKLLDWGAKNVIAVIVGESLSMFDWKSEFPFAGPEYMVQRFNTKVRAIKWNHAGTMIAVCTENSEIIMIVLESRKEIWRQKCHCTREKSPVPCEVLCITWTHTDKEIVTGCSEGRISSWNVSMGTLIDSVFVHIDMILNVAFSPNDRYLVSTSLDKAVRVLTWPNLTAYLSIGYYEPVEAFAWHPWDTGIMCVGGGFNDGSLTLWDIHRQKSLGYRKVLFPGAVKTLIWNKLSGELVVHWNYQIEDSRIRAITTVLASLDEIVDIVSLQHRILDVVFNPDGTKIALRIKDAIKIWNFFGNETSNWCDDKDKKNASKKKMIASAGRSCFDLCNSIR